MAITVVYVMGEKGSSQQDFRKKGFFIGDVHHLSDCFGGDDNWAPIIAEENDCWMKKYSVPTDKVDHFYQNYENGNWSDYQNV